MDPLTSAERWRRLQEVVDMALDLPPGSREAVLESVCGEDAALAEEARRLLHSCERAGSFLSTPAAAYAAPLIPGGETVPPKRIGPYRILAEAGQGGMGSVYLAERDDGQFTMRVALKVVRRGGDTEEILRRFLEERQILAGLQHPNIARLLDGGVSESGSPYLVMEYVQGLPIDRYCDEQRLGIEGRLWLFVEVCRAVQYAHQNLVVHRDLKPGNILVTPEGVPKLLDFGIAKLLQPDRGPEEAQGLTATGLRPMTPEYASPEQVLGEAVTTASDVYALGVLLYRLLAGRHPYGRERRRSARELERAVVEVEPGPPSSAAGDAEVAAARGTTAERLRRRLRGDLDAVVLRALRKDPAERYATADQLAEELLRHLGGRPVLARRGSGLYRASRLVRRHRAAVVAAGVVALALLAGAGTTAWQARVAAAERDRAMDAAATSARVSGFLEELFRVSDPAEGQGATITARELLDRGAARIARELAEEPEARIPLMTVMGRAYANLGEYQRAAGLLEEALAVQRGMPGAPDSAPAGTLLELARVRTAQGEFAQAEMYAREALRLRQAGAAPEEALADARAMLGEVLHQKGELPAAEQELRAALGMRRETPAGAPAVPGNLTALGRLLRSRGELEAAEPLYREALEIERRTLGPSHPDIGATLNDLGVLLYQRTDYPGSELLLREALELQRRVLGSDHPEVAKTINNLAAVLEKEGKLAEAEPLYREALDLKRASLGPEHPSVAVSMSNLALLLADRGQHAEADSLLRASLELRRRLLGPDHPSVGTALHNLAAQADRQRDPRAAERIYRQAMALRLRVLGPDHPDLATTLLGLGLVLLEEGENAEAEPHLREALRIRRLRLPAGSWQIAQTESALGACLLSRGSHAEAAPLLRSGYETLLRERGAGDRSTIRARENLALLRVP